MKRGLQYIFAGLTAALALTACEPNVAERGNMVDADRLAQIKPGLGKDEVVKIMGSPTTIAPFDENYWYYMGQRTEQEAFFKPEVTARRIVEVDFDENDKVTTVKELGKENGEDVEAVDVETAPQGHQTTLMEELFGRGGFGSEKNKKKKSDTGSGS